MSKQEQTWLDKSFKDSVRLLSELIEIPSYSRQENDLVDFFQEKMVRDKISFKRIGNNLLAYNNQFKESKKTILLNSHVDTVLPNESYTMDPFTSTINEGKLFGLGSNDAGASLVCLYEVFKQFNVSTNEEYNVIFAATAEEEISGQNGIVKLLEHLPPIELAIVGEPTALKIAIAEKGLLVLDCKCVGAGGHAAHGGENAIYKALSDIDWFRHYQFEKQSEMLGPIKMQVTMLSAGTQHNALPAECRFTVDVRTTDAYLHEELLEIIKQHVSCKVKARSMRLRSSGLIQNHFITDVAAKLSIPTYGSPTLSDQALMPFPSIKIGPGISERSHAADEFIYLHEIKSGLQTYSQLIKKIIQ